MNPEKQCHKWPVHGPLTTQAWPDTQNNWTPSAQCRTH